MSMPFCVVETPNTNAAGSRPLETLEVLALVAVPAQAPPTSTIVLTDVAYSQLE
jgi:hypothetical protein